MPQKYNYLLLILTLMVGGAYLYKLSNGSKLLSFEDRSQAQRPQVLPSQDADTGLR